MIIQKELAYAKEAGDVAVLLEAILVDVKAKKPAGEIAANNLQKLIDAINGADGIGAEVKDARGVVISTLLYHVGGMADALIGQKE